MRIVTSQTFEVDVVALERLPETSVDDAQLNCHVPKLSICNFFAATCIFAQSCQNTFQ
ncbi:MAG: hypothetical protein ACRDZ4_05205 [Egibacteraceae bacterium]